MAKCLTHIGTEGTAHLKTVLELAPSEAILGQLKVSAVDLEAVCKDGLLVKFLRLDAFMANNLKKDKNIIAPAVYSAAVSRVRSALSPSLARVVRHHTLISDFTGLNGGVGLYPSVEGVVHLRRFFCNQILVFSTFKQSVDDLHPNRNGPPDQILIALGLTFEPGELWIEVSYHIDDVRISSTEELVFSAVPSALEARGYWPFRIERDPLPVHGFTRNLSTGSRGVPEIVHLPVDVKKLRDAVVWAQPTRSSWGTYAPLYVY